MSICSEIFIKMGIYYGEQSGKGFKVKLKVSEEELKKYLKFWDRDEDLSGVSFSKCYGTEDQYVIWYLKHVIENLHKMMRCYDKEDDEAHLCSYQDDTLDIAYNSRKEGKLLRIDFDQILISKYDKDMARGTFYPMTLKGNVNPWDHMNVIVETIPELVEMRINLKKWRDILRKSLKNTLLTKNFVYDIHETISITEASFK